MEIEGLLGEGVASLVEARKIHIGLRSVSVTAGAGHLAASLAAGHQ